MRLIVLIAFFGLGACAQFPQIEGTLDATAKAADFPTLTPLAPVLALAQAGSGQNATANTADFAASIAQLRARAAALRGPVIDRATRQRMQRGVAVPAAIR